MAPRFSCPTAALPALELLSTTPKVYCNCLFVRPFPLPWSGNVAVCVLLVYIYSLVGRLYIGNAAQLIFSSGPKLDLCTNHGSPRSRDTRTYITSGVALVPGRTDSELLRMASRPFQFCSQAASQSLVSSQACLTRASISSTDG